MAFAGEAEQPSTVFRPLRHQDPELRAVSVDRVLDDLTDIVSSAPEVFLDILPVAKRIALECPFPDVRLPLQEFLALCQSRYGIEGAAVDPAAPTVSASKFFEIAKAQIIIGAPEADAARAARREAEAADYSAAAQARRAAAAADEAAADAASRAAPPPSALPMQTTLDLHPPLEPLMQQCFASFGEVFTPIVALCPHPAFAIRLADSLRVTMVSEGPLPATWRAYLGVMAASRHRAKAVLLSMTSQFLALGGDPEWLDGVSSPAVPASLRDLGDLNWCLAHAPWEMSPALVAAAAADHGDGGAGLTVNQLMQAIVVLTTTHSLCTLSLSLGLLPEPDSEVAIAALGLDPVEVQERELEAVAARAAIPGADTLLTIPGRPRVLAGDGAAGARATDDAVAGSAGGGLAGARSRAPSQDEGSAPATDGSADAADDDVDGDDEFGPSGGFDGQEELRIRLCSGLTAIASGDRDEGQSPAKRVGSDGGGGDEGSRKRGEAAGADAGAAAGGEAGAEEGEEEADADADADADAEADAEEEREGAGPVRPTGDTPEAGAAAAAPPARGGPKGRGKSSSAAEDKRTPAQKARALAAAQECFVATGKVGPDPPVERLRHMAKSLVREVDLKLAGYSKQRSTKLAKCVEKERIRMRPRPGVADPTTAHGAVWEAVFRRFCGPRVLEDRYQDFFVDGGAPLHTHDFSFGDGAYPVLSRFFPEVASPLEDELAVAFGLTYRSLRGETGVNTAPFRHGVWAYVTLLLGVRTDRFDYTDVNTFVTQKVKTFVKMAVCYPESVTRALYASMDEVDQDEKVHIAMLAMEARKQAVLLHACLAIREHFQ